MAQKKTPKGSESSTDKPKAANKKADKPKAEKKKADKPKVEKKKADKPKAEKKKASPKEQPVESARPVLTEEDAMAMAEALVEMFNEGAEHPVAFFVSADDALGRELIQLQGGELEDMEGLVPVVLDAAQVRRYAMLTIADEMIWRRTPEEES